MDRSGIKRRARGVGVLQKKTADFVKIRPFFEDTNLIHLIEPLAGGVNLPLWIRNNGQTVTDLVHKNGVVLFRGFDTKSEEDGIALNAALPWTQVEPDLWESTAPRHKVSENVFVASTVPKSESIFLHSDYTQSIYFAEKITFFCAQAPTSGGENPFADNREIARNLDSEVREMFKRKGWLLVRNIHESVGVNFRDSFWGRSKAEVEEFCLAEEIDLQWKGGGAVVSSVRDAIVTHPRTGESAWFNHVGFWHWIGLPKLVKEQMLNEFGPDGMPFKVMFGDGSIIPDEIALHVREVMVKQQRAFTWQQGDFLVADNILTSHGRAPYQGDRKTRVGLFDRTRRELFRPH